MSYESARLRLENWAEWNFTNDIHLGYPKSTPYERLAKSSGVFDEFDINETKFSINEGQAEETDDCINYYINEYYAVILKSFYLNCSTIDREAKLYGIHYERYKHIVDEAIMAVSDFFERNSRKLLTA